MVTKLLIVDSDLSFVAVLGPRLKAFGFEVLHAPTLDVAETLLHDSPPDLVILDVSHSNHADALDWLSRRDTHFRFMVLSDVADMKGISVAIDMGALDYIVKPCDLPRLVSKINHALAVAI